MTPARHPRRGLALLAAAGAVAIALAGCGEKKDTLAPKGSDSLRVVLDFFPNADHAGLYRAQQEGDFARAALKVTIVPPPSPTSPLPLLAAGKVDLAISYEPDLLLARAKGEPLIAVAALVQRPLTSIIAPAKSRIRSVADLRGKTVGTAGIPYQAAFLSAILARAKVPAHTVHTIDVGFKLVPYMIGGQVDATLGGYWNYEAVQLAQLHRDPTVIRVDQAGIPTYDELVLVARQETVQRHGELIRRFVQAMARGYVSARADPAAAVGALTKLGGVTDAKLQLASLRATLGAGAFFPAAGRPYGYMDKAAWGAFGRWMLANRLVKRDPQASTVADNEFLAGQGG